MVSRAVELMLRWAICLYSLLLFAFSVTGSKVFLALSASLCLVFAFFIRWRISYLLYYSIVTIFILISSFFWNLKFYQPLFFFSVSYLSGLFLYQRGCSKVGGLLLFFFVSGYFVFHFFNTSNLNEDIFFANSRNFISVWMIVCSIVCYSSRLPRNYNIVIFLICFALSVFSLGRSGIISTFILVFGYVIFSGTSNKLKDIVFFILIVVLIFVSFHEDISLLTDGVLERFQNSRAVDPRESVLQCYINSFDVENLFFGLNSKDDYCGTLAIGEYAPHNSFISLYANLGIFSLLYISISFMYKSSLELKIILISLLIRSSTDSVLFFTYFDFVYIYLVVKIINFKRESYEAKENL